MKNIHQNSLRGCLLLAATVCSIYLSAPVIAAETSVIVESHLSPDVLWKKVGDFCGIQSWFKFVEKCELSGDGRLRTLTIKGDDTLTGAVKSWGDQKVPPRKLSALAIDLLENWDDAKRCYSYTLVYGEAPISDYHSTICVVATADGAAIRWVGRYKIKPKVTAAAARKFLQDVYQTGANALIGE
jgi:hypothetical protein